MPILSPRDFREISAEKGILPQLAPTSGNSRRKRAQEHLENLGWGVEETVESLSSLARGAESEQIRYSATKDIAEIHDIKKPETETQSFQLNIVVQDGDVNLLGVLNPQRS